MHITRTPRIKCLYIFLESKSDVQTRVPGRSDHARLCRATFSRYYIWDYAVLIIITRKYMHAETPRLADKTIVFSEHEVFKVVLMVAR
jgi:hypothetical protein